MKIMFTPKPLPIKRLWQWLALPVLFSLLFSIGSIVPGASFAAGKPPTATPTSPGGATATPTNTAVPGGGAWSIGTLNDSKAEFSGTVGTFTVGTSPTSAFPGRLSGANTTQTIIFNMGSVTG